MFSTEWSREVWARAAAPALPYVQVSQTEMVSEATGHHALSVGQARWVVDYLPGRQFSLEQAIAAMRIAVAPDRLEVPDWAAKLGLSATEARGLLRLSEASA